jgi:UDPglucose 6-dehydrogenase
MNEIANLCELVGADVDSVRIGIGSDDRIGKRFLFPGIGYGGSCFPKDVQALAKSAAEVNYEFKILDSVMDINEKQKTIIVPKIKQHFNNDLKGKKIALWGLAFKPDTDDIREAPALYIIEELTKMGAAIAAYDPEAMNNVRNLVGDKITYALDEYDALRDADALLIATEWSLFRTPDFDRVSSLLKNKVIFDGRNLYGIQQMKELGYYYSSIGRETVK